MRGHAAGSRRAWRVVHAQVTSGAQRDMRSRSLGLFWQELADEDEMAEAAVGTDALSRDAGLIGAGGTLSIGEGLWRKVLRTLDVQNQAGVAGDGAFAWVPEAKIANLVQSFGQDMLKEAAHELVALEGADAPAVGLAVLVAERDGALVEANDA